MLELHRQYLTIRIYMIMARIATVVIVIVVMTVIMTLIPVMSVYALVKHKRF